jgi:hypothetical protein
MAREFLAGLIARARLGIPIGAPATPAVADLYAVGDTVRYRDSVNGERTLLNSAGNLANLTDISAARNNIGAAAAFAGYAVGNWICPVVATAAAGSALTANTIALHPFKVERACTISDLGFRVTTTVAGSSIQGAIYGSDSSNNPAGTPLGFNATGISAAIGAPVSGAVTPFTIQPGQIYWFAVNSDAAPTLLTVATANTYYSSILGAANLADITSSATSQLQLRTVAQTYGTWPSLTGATITVVTGAGAQKGALPMFKISALP